MTWIVLCLKDSQKKSEEGISEDVCQGESSFVGYEVK